MPLLGKQAAAALVRVGACLGCWGAKASQAARNAAVDILARRGRRPRLQSGRQRLPIPPQTLAQTLLHTSSPPSSSLASLFATTHPPPPPPLGSLSSPRSRSRRSGWPPRPRKGTPTRHFSGRRQHPCPLYNVEYNARLYTRHVVARPWGAVLFEWPARASQPRAVPASRRIESSRRHGRTADAGREDDVELL